jgi:hypothetical protein
LGAPPRTRAPLFQFAAVAALILAAAAFVVALTRDSKPARLPPVTAAPRQAPIAPDSLTGVQVDESKLGPVPRSTQADRAANARRLGGKGPSAFLPADRVAASGLIRVGTGETKTVVKQSPFTISARCSTGPKGATSLLVTVSSRRRGSVAAVAGRSLPAFGGTTTRSVMTLLSPRYVWASGQPFTLTAASGESLAGILSGGIKAFGADCAASVTAVG